MDFLTDRQKLLFSFVSEWHKDQKRKYTNDPYVNHLIEVAEIVSQIKGYKYLVEVALCHDLFEDTNCTYDKLITYLLKIKYTVKQSYVIADYVQGLTDIYTKENYPLLNREERKYKEALRLSKESKEVQTVKYADIISNSKSIFEHDKKFAKVFLKEKGFLLSVMEKGDNALFQQAVDLVIKSSLDLVINKK